MDQYKQLIRKLIKAGIQISHDFPTLQSAGLLIEIWSPVGGGGGSKGGTGVVISSSQRRQRASRATQLDTVCSSLPKNRRPQAVSCGGARCVCVLCSISSLTWEFNKRLDSKLTSMLWQFGFYIFLFFFCCCFLGGTLRVCVCQSYRGFLH